ncbi:MAG TPA: hypothetical protein VMZ52_06135 [Bryobacteraceae bacterium]|nr:hypothetical protein [Bryobacteraceae bacterium]
MRKTILSLLLMASAALAHTVAPAGAPPAFPDLLQKDGIKVMDGKKMVCELWFRSTAPSGPKSAEDNVSLPTIPQGALLGVIRFTEKFSDRRGQSIAPGTYTLRYSMFPQNGDHQGVAPQRDFLLLTPVAEDKDPAATPKFDALVAMSRKASGTPHPAVLSFWKQESDFKAGIAQQGEHDWVLQTKLGDLPVAVIVVGKAEG